MKGIELVNKRDREIIESLVLENPNYSFSMQITRLHKAFGINITPIHYIELGYVIGLICGTEQTREYFFTNQNPLSKCRVN